LIETFRALRRLLALRRLIFAQFPNDHSPFGRHYQHGGIIDKWVLSVLKICQQSSLPVLEIQRAGNSHRPGSRNPLKWMLQTLI
jgi:hypothetical protein